MVPTPDRRLAFPKHLRREGGDANAAILLSAALDPQGAREAGLDEVAIACARYRGVASSAGFLPPAYYRALSIVAEPTVSRPGFRRKIIGQPASRLKILPARSRREAGPVEMAGVSASTKSAGAGHESAALLLLRRAGEGRSTAYEQTRLCSGQGGR